MLKMAVKTFFLRCSIHITFTRTDKDVSSWWPQSLTTKLKRIKRESDEWTDKSKTQMHSGSGHCWHAESIMQPVMEIVFIGAQQHRMGIVKYILHRE